MYDKLNITENHLQIMSLFTNGFDREYYIREVEKLLRISPRTAQLILEDLENKGVIESKTKGKIKAYTLKKNSLSQRYIIFAEQYKSIIFFEKNLIIKEIIDKLKPFVNGIGVIFGSYAKGISDSGSDLDILIVGSYNKKEFKKISKMYGIEISLKCYPLKIFEKGVNNDVLIKEILKYHILFLNQEQFIKMVIKNG